MLAICKAGPGKIYSNMVIRNEPLKQIAFPSAWIGLLWQTAGSWERTQDCGYTFIRSRALFVGIIFLSWSQCFARSLILFPYIAFCSAYWIQFKKVSKCNTVLELNYIAANLICERGIYLINLHWDYMNFPRPELDI